MMLWRCPSPIGSSSNGELQRWHRPTWQPPASCSTRTRYRLYARWCRTLHKGCGVRKWLERIRVSEDVEKVVARTKRLSAVRPAEKSAGMHAYGVLPFGVSNAENRSPVHMRGAWKSANHRDQQPPSRSASCADEKWQCGTTALAAALITVVGAPPRTKRRPSSSSTKRSMRRRQGASGPSAGEDEHVCSVDRSDDQESQATELRCITPRPPPISS